GLPHSAIPAFGRDFPTAPSVAGDELPRSFRAGGESRRRGLCGWRVLGWSPAASAWRAEEQFRAHGSPAAHALLPVRPSPTAAADVFAGQDPTLAQALHWQLGARPPPAAQASPSRSRLSPGPAPAAPPG